jgi:hypothetical protein
MSSYWKFRYDGNNWLCANEMSSRGVFVLELFKLSEIFELTQSLVLPNSLLSCPKYQTQPISVLEGARQVNSRIKRLDL